ncbi:MAG: PEP-utilizing enzyme [Chloroflexi bacterium]|nr:PEP-utilizing enzyme [Chloroflexota bacterium]MDA1269838.1 PEP-utilizing enzyme [Chloroflexota bacterium]
MTAQTDLPIPSDMEGFWQWDKMHCPRPQTTLTQDLFNSAISAGFTGGMNEFACPAGVVYRNINTYAYIALVPQDLGEETIEQRVGRYKENLGTVLPNMGKLWEEEWLPSILPGLKSSMDRDYTALSDQELIQTLEQMQQEFIARYVVHGKINFVIASAGMFVDFYNEFMDPEDPTEAYEALQGYPTLSLDAGRAMWALGRRVNRSTALRQLFEQHQPDQLLLEMEATEEGRGFLAAFREYLDEFGWRSDAFELADPTWREDPKVPLNAIQGYMRLDDTHDPDVKYQQAVKRREELLATARETLSSQPEQLEKFNNLYHLAEPFATITENHNYYIDQRGNSVMRLPILEMGRRLAEKGAIKEQNDVFHLTFEEIKSAFSGTDQRALVAERMGEIDRWSKIVPMPVIGEPPAHEGEGDPLGNGFAKFFGVPPEPSRDPDIIQGLGASPGTIQGTAKVVRTLAEASKLEQGDIMVCEMTMPPWTPLFSIAGAVVADTGGPLSHCAIVSREYKMPCVVGTVVGTAVITDGMTLTVDGAKGIVRIDSRG